MNTKTTLLVLIVAAGLAAYFILFETEPKKPSISESETPTVGQALFAPEALPLDKVKLIRIQRGSDAPVVVERDMAGNGDWTQTTPVRFPMQSFMINDLVTAAAGLRSSSSITPAEKKLRLDQIGLAPPQASITFEGDGVAKTTISLGSRTAAGRAYAALGAVSESSAVYVVDDRLHELLARKISQMRSTTLPAPGVGGVRRITLMRDGVTARLVSKDSRWMLTEPVTGRADRAAAESLVSAIGAASIERFIEDNPASLSPFGLDKPQVLLTIESLDVAASTAADKKGAQSAEKPTTPAEKFVTHKLTVGSATDLDNTSYFAMWDDSPVVFSLRKAEVERFLKKPDDLRDPTITAVTRADIKELTLDRPGSAGKIQFIIDQGKWTFGDPKPGYSLDAAELDKLLDAIIRARAVAYVPAKEPLPPPLATLRMAVNQAQPEALTIRAGDSAEKLMVVRNDETTGYVIKSADLAGVLEPALAFRERNIIDVMPDALASIKIMRPGIFAAQYEFLREAPEAQGPPTPGSAERKPAKKGDASKFGDWKLEGFDKNAFANLMAAIAPLRARQWLDLAPPTGPNDPVLEIKTVDGKTHSLTLHLAGHSGNAAGVDKAFELDPALQEIVSSELRDKSVLKLGPDQVAAVKGGGWTVKRDSSGKFALDGGGELDEPKAALLFNTIAELQAVRFIDASRAVGDPTATLTFTVSGKSQTLKVWMPKGADPIAQLGDRTFTITPETAAALTGKPAK